jgi:hypothetical protein
VGENSVKKLQQPTELTETAYEEDFTPMWRGLRAEYQCSEEESSWIGAWDLSKR